jgi:hypothetical protein
MNQHFFLYEATEEEELRSPKEVGVNKVYVRRTSILGHALGQWR